MIDPTFEAEHAGTHLRPFVPTSLAARVADAIVDAIAANELQPGQRLIETDLAGTLEVVGAPETGGDPDDHALRRYAVLDQIVAHRDRLIEQAQRLGHVTLRERELEWATDRVQAEQLQRASEALQRKLSQWVSPTCPGR